MDARPPAPSLPGGANPSVTQLLNQLQLDPVLQERIRLVSKTTSVDLTCPSFVLYLPTVNLRRQHNPSFALACHLANALDVPVLVLCTILDDAHHNIALTKPLGNDNERLAIVGTARRLCFQLQALQKAGDEWERHGCAVAIRVHGPSCRRPHHLTLARQATVTLVDEPFVHPYRNYVQTIARAAKVCLCVDGSTTVPPVSILRPLADGKFAGVPPKAWMWRKKMEGKLERNLHAVVEQGAFDAPVLQQPSPVVHSWHNNQHHPLHRWLPKEWRDRSVSAPGERAWTVHELCAIDPYAWSVKWPGTDTTVGPCRQTDGKMGWERWQAFQRSHLSSYANKRNNIKLPHAVSRLSCFLNVGAVSIFQIVQELRQDQRNTEKFQDEIIKWREISYAHAFSTPDYFAAEALPTWSRDYLAQCHASGGGPGYSLTDLCDSRTNDLIWNAMQTYLRETGELHNNARMTWGKTALHWQKYLPIADVFHHLACLNDRYALDGLSPPSYAGLLWCFGWCDKPSPGDAISTKPASRYRVGSEGFVEAQKSLLALPRLSIAQQLRQQLPRSAGSVSRPCQRPTSPTGPKPVSSDLSLTVEKKKQNSAKKKRTIDSYFAPTKPPAMRS